MVEFDLPPPAEMEEGLLNASRPGVFQPNFRPRILALHGARSNDSVTMMQLENLCITEEDYDIVYMRGPIEVEEGDPELEGLVYGPFYSWLDEDEEKRGASLIAAVRDVLTVAKHSGPVDGIYGFSSGGHVAAAAAAIATDTALQLAIQAIEVDRVAKRGSSFSGSSAFLAAAIATDTALQQAIQAIGVDRVAKRGSSFSRTSSIRASMLGRAGGDNGKTSLGGRNSVIGRKSAIERNSVIGRESVGFKSFSSRRRSSIIRAAPALADGDLIAPPFSFVVLACSASPTPDLATLRKSARLHPMQLEPGSMATKSFHLIGIEDGFKAQSEEIASFFADRHVRYLPGGHSVGRDERSDEELCLSLKVFMRSLGSPPPKVSVPIFVPMSEVTSIALLPHIQVALVKLNHDLLPGGSLTKHEGGATIKALLEAQPAEKPFLYNARGTNADDVTTYGDVSNFIHGGAGDLRRLGVKAGEVVAVSDRGF
jgi:hypothetical protein